MSESRSEGSRRKLPDESESSLLRVAEACFYGVKQLVSDGGPGNHVLIAYAILVAQGIEATLKCHLLQQNRPLSKVRALRHDLIAAWDAAAAAGPPIVGPAPSWLESFNWGHAQPYFFRYLPDGYGFGVSRPEDFLPWWESVLRQLYRSSQRL